VTHCKNLSSFLLLFFSHTKRKRSARPAALQGTQWLSKKKKKKKKISSLDAVLVKNHFQIIAYRSSIFFIFNSLIIRLLKKKFTSLFQRYIYDFYFHFIFIFKLRFETEKSFISNVDRYSYLIAYTYTICVL